MIRGVVISLVPPGMPDRSRIAIRSFLLLLVWLLVGCTERRQQNLIRESEEKTARSQYSEAAELLKKAIALNPESGSAAKALYKLGFTQESYLKDMDGALFNYNEYIRLSRDPVSVYEVLKRVASIHYDQVQDYDKAIVAYKRLLTLSPESLEADLFQLRVSLSFYQQNKFDQSREELQTLINKYPKSQYLARARYEVGNSYYMEGKYEIAIEALKQVLRLHPQTELSTEAQFLMGQCYEHLDRPKEALQTYENIEGRYASPEILAFRMNVLRKKLKTTK